MNRPLERGVASWRFRGFESPPKGDSLIVDHPVQRLFSTFPQGLPGIGLVLLRAAVAIPLLQLAIAGPQNSSAHALLGLVAAGAALWLLVGLWTPVAGAFVAVAEIVLAFSHPAEPWPFVHLGVLGAVLALIGPGAWSVDARLFGRKHIQIPER